MDVFISGTIYMLDLGLIEWCIKTENIITQLSVSGSIKDKKYQKNISEKEKT